MTKAPIPPPPFTDAFDYLIMQVIEHNNIIIIKLRTYASAKDSLGHREIGKFSVGRILTSYVAVSIQKLRTLQ